MSVAVSVWIFDRGKFLRHCERLVAAGTPRLPFLGLPPAARSEIKEGLARLGVTEAPSYVDIACRPFEVCATAVVDTSPPPAEG